MSALPPKADISLVLCDKRTMHGNKSRARAARAGVMTLNCTLSMRPETKSHDNQLTLRKSPTHVDPRQTRLDIELRFQHTVGFDKSHTGVDRQIFCHRHIGAELDSG